MNIRQPAVSPAGQIIMRMAHAINAAGVDPMDRDAVGKLLRRRGYSAEELDTYSENAIGIARGRAALIEAGKLTKDAKL